MSCELTGSLLSQESSSDINWMKFVARKPCTKVPQDRWAQERLQVRPGPQAFDWCAPPLFCFTHGVSACSPLASVPGVLYTLGSWPGALALFAELPNLILVFRNGVRLLESKQGRNRGPLALVDSMCTVKRSQSFVVK